jgi:hypothetical protein
VPSARTHTHEVPLFFHDFSFLPRFSDNHARTHTLNAGQHTFPFSLNLPSELPATIRTYSGSGQVSYQLKAIVTRPGFVVSNWVLKKPVPVHRGLLPDSEEYTATLEIGRFFSSSFACLLARNSLTISFPDNTWPGKIAYAFTVPYKVRLALVFLRFSMP